MFYVYIIQSSKDVSYYIGHTKDTEKRLKQHNSGRVRSTKAKKPWRLVYKESFNTKKEAYKRELQIKSYKGGEALKKLFK